MKVLTRLFHNIPTYCYSFIKSSVMRLRRYFNSFLKGEKEFYVKVTMDTITRILGGQFSVIYIKLILGVMELINFLKLILNLQTYGTPNYA